MTVYNSTGFYNDPAYYNSDAPVLSKSGGVWVPSKIIRPQQPQGLPTVDWTNPISKNLTGLLWAGHGKPRDLLDPTLAFSFNSTLRPTSQGIGYGADVAGKGVYTARGSFPRWNITTPPLSCVYLGTANGHTATCSIAGNIGSTSGYRLMTMYSTGDAAAATTIDSVQRVAYGTGPWKNPTAIAIRGMTVTATDVTGYDHGIKFGSSGYTTGSALAYDNTYGRIAVGTDGTDYTCGPQTNLWMALWNRPLNPAEMLSLQQKPWQLFTPISKYSKIFNFAKSGISVRTSRILPTTMSEYTTDPNKVNNIQQSIWNTSGAAVIKHLKVNTINESKTISSYWISQGLQFLLVPNKTTPKVKVGTKSYFTNKGVFTGFGSTLGAGTTDVVGTGDSYTQALKNSLIVVFTYRGAGGGGFGRLFIRNDQNTGFRANATGGVSYLTFGSSGAMEFEVIAAPEVGKVYSVVATYDGVLGGATAPLVWVNGVSVTPTSLGGSAGTVTATTDKWWIGNRDNTTPDRNWDGSIALAGMFSRILDKTTAAALSYNYNTLFTNTKQPALPLIETRKPVHFNGLPKVVPVVLTSKKTGQPQYVSRVNWSNPLTRGLQACVVPLGNTAIELVTGVVGTATGTHAQTIGSVGKSRRAAGVIAVAGDGVASTDKVIWPASTTLRGASLDATGTVLAVGGSTEQVDARMYCLGGNTENLAGHGFGLWIDSYSQLGRGNIIKANYVPTKTSSVELLGNPFGNRVHAFGYRFNGNGAAGAFLSDGKTTAFSGSPTHGSNKTSRQLMLFSDYSTGGGAVNHKAFVALFCMWGRELSDAEYASWYDNPWQLIRPQSQQLYQGV